MILNFMGKKKGGHGHHHSEPPKEEMQKMLGDYQDEPEDGDLELANRK